MKTKYLFLMVIFLLSASIYAQKKAITYSKKPTSIYTFSKFSNDKNSFSAINKKLNLYKLNFIIVDQNDIDTNTFSFDFDDLGKKSSALVYEDYLKYRDENLLKGFLLKNDPTRWNLQCPNPLSVQPTN